MPASAEADNVALALDWDDQWLVGHSAIDREHQLFIALLRAMQSAGDGALADLLDVFDVHLQRHFAQEEALMDRYRFPAAGCHRDEHDKVRQSLREVRSLTRQGDTDIGRELLQALAQWFPLHAQTMDVAVAQWATRKTSGGLPVVLRRPPSAGLAAPPDPPG